MKAVYIKGKEDLEIAEVPVPEPGPDQVRLKVAYVGICGSDLHYYFNGANGTFVVREPLIPGHEMSGYIDADPQGEWAQGTPVTVHPATFGPEVPGMENLRHLRPGGSYLGSASTWPRARSSCIRMGATAGARADGMRAIAASLAWRNDCRRSCAGSSTARSRPRAVLVGPRSAEIRLAASSVRLKASRRASVRALPLSTV